MVRIVLAVVLLMQLLAQGAGLVYAANELACDDETSEDCGEDDCSPGCEDCLCCSHHRVVMRPIESSSTILDTRVLAFPSVRLELVEPEPGEIMHVPKPGLTA